MANLCVCKSKLYCFKNTNKNNTQSSVCVCVCVCVHVHRLPVWPFLCVKEFFFAIKQNNIEQAI